jgi:hypothetical protein
VAPESKSPPYSTYAALVGIFGAGMAGVGALASLRGSRPEHLTPLDLAVLSAATFKASRTVAHDEVLSFLRQPFVQGEAHEGDEKPSRTAAPDRHSASCSPAAAASGYGLPPAWSGSTPSPPGPAVC